MTATELTAGALGRAAMYDEAVEVAQGLREWSLDPIDVARTAAWLRAVADALELEPAS